jgi:hypothetical protein
MNMHSSPSLGDFPRAMPPSLPPVDLAERKASAARLAARHNTEIANRRASVEAAVDASETGGQS